MADILVVDDEEGIRRFLQEMLVRDGHRVVSAASGEAALEICERRAFDLALVDLRLGGIDGIQVLVALRARFPDIVVIVLTAHATLETAVEALRRGAHDYLFKPCKVIELRESVRTGLLKHQHVVQRQQLIQQLVENMIARPAEAGAARAPAEPAESQERFVRHGALIVDLMRHVVTAGGHVLELSPTEFSVVAYLAGEAPRVVPPDELVRAAQGYECPPWEARNVLRYHAHRIRLKVRQATGSNHDLIRTVRGVGYALADDWECADGPADAPAGAERASTTGAPAAGAQGQEEA